MHGDNKRREHPDRERRFEAGGGYFFICFNKRPA